MKSLSSTPRPLSFHKSIRGRASRRLSSSSSSSNKLTVGIRREDPKRIWERRTPITPAAVYDLVRDGNQVLVQSCDRRVFPDSEFIAAGASITRGPLDPASIVVGIKEVPLNELLTTPVNGRPRTQIMFSHTAKGQSYNLPLLQRFLTNENSPTLVDYEQLTDDNGKRTVAFGFYAGSAGVIEGLAAAALDLLTIGIASPFLHLPRAYANRDLRSMKASLHQVGQQVALHGTPAAAGPFIIAVTGNGNVVNGALDMLKELPVKYVTPEELPRLVADSNTDLKQVYIVHVSPSSYLFRRDGGAYSRKDYYAHPSEYHSVFYETIAPYISLLINGAGWQPGFPRLMSNDQLTLALRNAKVVGKARFRSVSDISCDVNGGLEFVSRSTTIDDPFYTARPENMPPDLDGVQVMAVDILPSEVPLDASEHFSNAFLPYLRALARRERQASGLSASSTKKEGHDDKLLDALDRASIARHGKLAEKHRWLYEPLKSVRSEEEDAEAEAEADTISNFSAFPAAPVPLSSSSSSTRSTALHRRKKVLLFGSGMVAKPFCKTMWDRSEDIELIVASNNIAEANELVRGYELETTVVRVDITDSAKVGQLVEGADIVASLLPAAFHPRIAEHCISHRKHLVTASYISPAMRAFHDSAVDADVLFLNETGLDPGIDHLSAMELRDRMLEQGKRIVSFVSWCGGLPAPEDSNVPLGMKFSWSPKALLSAALNDAKFKMANQIYSIPGEELLSSYFRDVSLSKGFALEGLANRDSLSYADTYGLGSLSSLETVFRGTLRFKGFSELLHSFKLMGLLRTSDEQRIAVSSWNELGGASIASVFGVSPGDSHGIMSEASIESALKDVLPNRASIRPCIDALKALAIIPGYKAANIGLPPVPKGPHTPLDLLATLLAHKLKYQPHERDMVILSHEITTVPIGDNASSSSGASVNRETHTSTLVTYGDPDRGSAMSRTVGLPLAFATLRVLNGQVRARGVLAPVEKEVYRPVLDDLREVDIVMRESSGGPSMVDGLVRGLRESA